MESFIERCLFYNRDEGELCFENADEKQSFNKVWQDKNQDFWCKVVIVVREFALEKLKFIPFESDRVFIDVLRRLSSRSFVDISDFISNAVHIRGCRHFLPNTEAFINAQPPESERKAKYAVRCIIGNMDHMDNVTTHVLQQFYDLNIFCAGTLINIFENLQTSCNDESQLKWQPPLSWFYPSSYKRPFEAYIEEKFFHVIVCQMNKSEVGWLSTNLRERKIPDDLEREPPENFTPNMGWLPQKRDRKIDESKPLFETLWFVTASMSWCTLIASFSSLMSRKFHIASASALDVRDPHCMSIGPFFALWQEAFGANFIDFLNNTQTRFLSMARQTAMVKLPDNLSGKILKDLLVQYNQLALETLTLCGHQIANPPYSPRQPGDNVESSAEFLFQPQILVQLPWSDVMYRQWIGVAVMEVLKFELETVELRHLPIPPVYEACTRELLAFVKQTKETVLLGLYLYCRQGAAYPNTFKKVPAKIMDSVVLPILPALEFLCSGEAYRILHSLRKLVFAETMPLTLAECNKFKWMPQEIYLANDALQEFFSLHYWHINYWTRTLQKEPIPTKSLSANATLSESQSFSSHIPKQVTQLNKEEDVLYGLWYEKDFETKIEKLVPTMIDATKLVLKEVVKLGYFPRSELSSLVSTFTSAAAKSEVEELKHGDKSPKFFKTALTSCYLYLRIRDSMNGVQKANTIEGWGIRLTGEIMERDLLARVALACSLHVTHQTPAVPGIKNVKSPSSLPVMLEQIRAVQGDRGSRNRAWLWAQLPPSWNMPVTQHDQAPQMTPEVSLLDSVKSAVTVLEGRVHQLLGALSRDSYQVWESGREAFPEWHMLQYVMPGHLSALLDMVNLADTITNRSKAQNLADFLHAMVSLYENKYHTWFTEIKEEDYRLEDQPKLFYEDEGLPVAVLGNNFMKCVSMSSHISQMMHAYVGTGDNFEGIPGQAARSFVLSHFQTHFEPLESMEKPSVLGYMFVFAASQKLVNGYFSDMLSICNEVWPIPAPGLPLPDEHLAALYLADAVLDRLTKSMSDMLMPTNADFLHGPKKTDGICFVCPCSTASTVNLRIWRAEMISKVVQIVKRGPYKNERRITKQSLSQILKDGKILLNDMWAKFSRSVDDVGSFPTNIEVLPTDTPKLLNIFELFKSGCLDEVGKLLQLSMPSGTKVSKQTLKSGVKKQNHNSSKKAEKTGRAVSPQLHTSITSDGPYKSAEATKKDATKVDKQNAETVAGLRCSFCRKRDNQPENFIKCEECAKDKNYPSPQFYCSTACKERALEDHMTEHLEFSLGLSNLGDSE